MSSFYIKRSSRSCFFDFWRYFANQPSSEIPSLPYCLVTSLYRDTAPSFLYKWLPREFYKEIDLSDLTRSPLKCMRFIIYPLKAFTIPNCEPRILGILHLAAFAKLIRCFYYTPIIKFIQFKQEIDPLPRQSSQSSSCTCDMQSLRSNNMVQFWYKLSLD